MCKLAASIAAASLVSGAVAYAASVRMSAGSTTIWEVPSGVSRVTISVFDPDAGFQGSKQIEVRAGMHFVVRAE